MRRLIFAAVALAAVPAAAQVPYHADGHSYDMSCNASGYVLRSRHPVVRTVGSGAGTRAVEGRESLYLGRDCDAFHEVFGEGRWCWANAGFGAEFPEHRFWFSRQEPVCPNTVDQFGLGCRC